MFEDIELTAINKHAGGELVLEKDMAARQAYGAYYTPLRVASILADWAIRNPEDKVLEPCFGGCDFLEAMQNRYMECGQTQLVKHIFGCDIDPDAFAHLSSRMNSMMQSGNFLQADFLTTSSGNFGQDNFDAVIGNPPYIKNDRISSIQKNSIKDLPKDIHECVKGRANLWAYFVMHAMTFLRVGGRMAWVLPGNFLTADYSSSLRVELSKKFKRVMAVSVAERLFLSQGTEERTVVLLCDGYQQRAERDVQIKYCSSSIDLRKIISDSETDGSDDSAGDENYQLLSKDQMTAFLEVARQSHARKIGEFGNVYIGIVIGDKKFFIRRMSDWKKTAITESYFEPVVSKFKHLSGLITKQADIDLWKINDQECFLLNTRDRKLGTQVQRYLATNKENEKGNNSTFLRREIWHQPDDGRIADAFIACLNNLGPRMVLNPKKLQATNSLYRFNFALGLDKSNQRLLAISMLTTFSQLSAELNGRQLGSGGLKLEPKGVSNILVAMNPTRTEAEIASTFSTMDELIRLEKIEEARLVADEFMLDGQLMKCNYELLCSGLKRIRSHRLRSKTPRVGRSSVV